jgi:hypothetical protein
MDRGEPNVARDERGDSRGPGLPRGKATRRAEEVELRRHPHYLDDGVDGNDLPAKPPHLVQIRGMG